MRKLLHGLLTVCRTALALAVVAVVVSDDEGVGVNLVLDRAAEAVTAENHGDGSANVQVGCYWTRESDWASGCV